MDADALPLVPGVTVASQQLAPGVANDDKINYLVLTGPDHLAAKDLQDQERTLLKRDGWTTGSFGRKLEAVSSDNGVLAIVDPVSGCRKIAAPRRLSDFARTLEAKGNLAVCATLAPHSGPVPFH